MHSINATLLVKKVKTTVKSNWYCPLIVSRHSFPRKEYFLVFNLLLPQKRNHEEISFEFETSIPSESQMTFLALAILASVHADDGF